MEQPNDNRYRRAWIHLAIGSAGVILVCLLYVLSPPEAVLADFHQDLTVARAAVLNERGFMHWIGFFGVLFSPTVAIGALGVSQIMRMEGRERLAHAFQWLTMAGVMFALVDPLAGFGLRAAAAAGPEGFAVAKRLFDGLTGGASFIYGISAVMLAWSRPEAQGYASPHVLVAFGVVGAGLALAALASLAGAPAGLLVGVLLTLLTVLYGWLALQNLYYVRTLPLEPRSLGVRAA